MNLLHWHLPCVFDGQFYVSLKAECTYRRNDDLTEQKSSIQPTEASHLCFVLSEYVVWILNDKAFVEETWERFS